MKTTILALGLTLGLTLVIASPATAIAGKHTSTGQANADRARASAAKHAAKGNDSAARNMQKIANDRQRAADRKATRDAGKKH